MRLIDSTFNVSVDGQPRLAWTDPNVRRASGLVALRTCRTDTVFDNVTVRAIVAADFDKDLDVDVSDFSFFQACFNGPNRPPALVECGPTDFDGDADTDLSDFALFQSCFNGPNRSPACP